MNPPCPLERQGTWRIFGSLLALLLIALAPSSRALAQTERPTVRLQLQWFHQAQFAGFYVAAALGYYEREGIHVELIPAGTDPATGAVIEPIEAMLQGRADVAIAWLSSALLAGRKGHDVVNIAQIFQRPATMLLCRRDAGIRSAEGLARATIGVWNVGDQYNVAYWLRVHGLSTANVTLVQQRPEGRDLIERKVACATAMAYDEYWRILNGGLAAADLTIFRLDEDGEAFLEDGLYVPASALDDPVQRDRLARFLRATAAGWRYAAENPEDALAMLLVRVPDLDPAHQRRMLDTVLSLTEPKRRFGLLDLALFERSVAIVGFGVDDPAGIAAAADRRWTHQIWYAAGLDASDRRLVSFAVRHRLAAITDATWFYALDLIGTIAFGFAGFMRAHQRRYDLWGAFMLTLLPAVAGGTLRDLLIGGDRHPPFIFKDPVYIAIVLGVVLLGTGMARFLSSGAAQSVTFNRALTIFDTLGLAVFTVIGAKVALMAGVAWFWVPICAALTCAGGGMLLDIVTGQEPRTFQGEPYEEIAVGGGLLMLCGLLLASQFEHAGWLVTATIPLTMVVVFLVRMMVVTRGLRSYRLGGEIALGRRPAPGTRP